MVVWERTVVCSAGKLGELVPWAKEVCAYVDKTHGQRMKVFTEIGGNPMAIVLHAEYKDLADFESKTQKVMADPEIFKLMAKCSAFVQGGMTRDSVRSELA